MGNSFQTQLAADAINVFAGTTDFGESITVATNNGSGGSSWTFVTNVLRVAPNAVTAETLGGLNKIQPELHVFLPFDAAGLKGVPSQPDRGGTWIIRLADVIGGTAKDHPIVEITSSDQGGWWVRVR